MSDIQADASILTPPDTNIASPRLCQGADVVMMHEHHHKSGKISLCLHAVPFFLTSASGQNSALIERAPSDGDTFGDNRKLQNMMP